MEGIQESKTRPFVSVIMPVRNEARFIGRALRSLFNQTYPKDLMEIIVADGMSADETRSVVEQLAAEADVPVKIVDNPKQIAPSGLNRAVEKASGEIIIRVDGHCEVDEDYVANCVDLLLAGKAEGVGGPIETIGEGRHAEAIALAMSSPFGVGGSAFRTINDREMYTDTVAFPGYTREILSRAGAFDEELVRNQDDEYNYRIRELGGRILLSPAIRSRYFSRSTFSSLWRQYFQYGYWKVRVLQLHPGQMRTRQFVPFIFVTSLIILSIFSLFSTIGRWLLAGTVICYLIANVIAALKTSQFRLRAVPVLSVSFFILHFSYGLGSLVGLFRFGHNWFSPKTNIDRASTAH